MDTFLKDVKNSLKTLSTFGGVHAVLGSEACDLDSAVSTLTYAYLLHRTNKDPDVVILPVLNVCRRDFPLKTEVAYFLEENGISSDDLVFKNEVDLKGLHNNAKLVLTIVDHNALVKPDTSLQPVVVEIIDHHKRSLDNYGDGCEVTIDFVGSCSTLVAEKILAQVPSLVDARVAKLLMGTILLDTVCLDDIAGRVTIRDKDVFQTLQGVRPDVTKTQLFEALQRAKSNITGLSVNDLLRKDLKLVSNCSINIAISSIPILVQDCMSRIATVNDLKLFNTEHNYHVLVIMGMHISDADNRVTRDIGVYSINTVCKQQVADLLAEAPELQLDPVAGEAENHPCLSVFRQSIVASSRKVVLPIVNEFLNGGEGTLRDMSTLSFKARCAESSSHSSRDNRSEEFNDFDPFDTVGDAGGGVFTPPNGITMAASAAHFLGMGDSMSLPLSSQSSSAQNSCPYTPQNSYIDGDFDTDPYAKYPLPSFNSRDMMEKIEIKRGKLRGYEGDTDENYPFTPKNSFVDSGFEAYVKHLPSFDSDAILQKLNEKQVANVGVFGEAAAEDADGRKRSANGRPPLPAVVASNGSGGGHPKITVVVDDTCYLSRADRSLNSEAGGGCGGGDAAGEVCSSLNASAPAGAVRREGAGGDAEVRLGTVRKDSGENSSPEENSLASSRGDKCDEKMDISTSGSDKDAVSPAATVPVSNSSDNKFVNGTADNAGKTRTRYSSSTSTLSAGHDVETELAMNYQAETVDFPDSPHHMKLLARQTHGDLKDVSLDEDMMAQDDDEVFRAVLSPGTDDVILKKDRPNTLSKGKKKKIKVTPDILNATENDDDAKSLSSVSNKSGDILSPVDDLATPDDIDTPDELEDSAMERLGSNSEPIPELTAAEEYDEERSWRTCVIAGVQRKIDMKVIDHYKKVLSHGGYCQDTRYAIIVFSACHLPDRSRRDYDYVMDNLFLYVLTTLDALVAEDYVLIYLHGATDRGNMPSFGWLKRCYQMIDRRLRKNLKGLYLVHPTFWLKTIVLMTKPFISTKFSRKLRFVATLKELSELIPMDHVCIPDKVKQYDEEREIALAQ